MMRKWALLAGAVAVMAFGRPALAQGPFADVPTDRVREYWNRRPCNLRHSQAPVGTREYFDQVEARKYFVEPHIPGFAEHSRWAGKRVLEIGCGLGTDTMNFARAGARVTAVDLSSRSLDLARQRAEVFGLQDRVTFIEADAERLSEFVEPAEYDLVYSFGVIHHTPHPDRALEQIRRHFSGPRTTLKIMVYYRWAWKVFAIVFREAHGAFWKLDEAVARNSEAQTGCPVTYTYTRRSVERLLTESGFRVEHLFVDHIFPYRIPDYVQYRYVKAFPFNLLPGADTGYWGLLWFLVKVLIMLFIFIWLRGTLPRLRYDQFMRFGWRWLIPISLVWTLMIAVLRLGQREGWFSGRGFWFGAAAVFAVLVGLAFFGGKEEPKEGAEEPAAEEAGEFDAFAGGYPVPPMAGQVLPEFAQVLRGEEDLPPDRSPDEQPTKEGSEA